MKRFSMPQKVQRQRTKTTRGIVLFLKFSQPVGDEERLSEPPDPCMQSSSRAVKRYLRVSLQRMAHLSYLLLYVT